MCRYANMQMCKLINSIFGRTGNISVHFAHSPLTKKALSFKQDGFNIFSKSNYRLLPVRASLMLSLATIASLNE
jgi:hypothetical protein